MDCPHALVVRLLPDNRSWVSSDVDQRPLAIELHTWKLEISLGR
jgi:hypothetical protein